MTTSNTNSFDYGKLAYDRTEIADTLYPYAAGLDLGDAGVLASSFTEDGSPALLVQVSGFIRRRR